MKAYAGIGSRETPREVLYLMRDTAYILGRQGWTLRSGCAPGADSAFEDGAWDVRTVTPEYLRVPRPELFLPWPRFEGRRKTIVARETPQPEAFTIAAQHHPTWDRLSDGAKALHARNVHQILGPDVTTPHLSRFVICWTKGGAGGGGTGQAIRIARAYDVPVFDLARPEDRQRIENWLEK